MEVILLEKVQNLGSIGDRVEVRSGYGRNYLLPQGKAALATPENVARLEAQRAELERKAADELTRAQARAEQLKGVAVEITAKVGSEGKLFGSIGTSDIAVACSAAGVEVERAEVRLPEEGPLRSVGEHEVTVHLHPEVEVAIKVNVRGEE